MNLEDRLTRAIAVGAVFLVPGIVASGISGLVVGPTATSLGLVLTGLLAITAWATAYIVFGSQH